ncbi:MAG TPA: hypothetical protein PKA64_06170, partial [Myxococcota bacterium]|nr:hypothetical protein [Myxococcota bacterium]
TYAIEIYADVATITAGAVKLAAGRGVAIVARRLVLSGSLTFADTNSTITWYTQEVDGQLQVAGPGGAAATVSDPGLYLTWSTTGLLSGPYTDLDPAMLSADSSLYRYANTAMLIATALFTEQPDLCAAMSGWVARIAGASSAWGTLAHDAATLTSMRRAQPPGALYVPVLDMSVYATTAAGWITPVAACESQWRTMVDQTRAIADRIAAARTMLAYYQDRTTAWNEMIGRAKKDLDDANDAWEKAKQRYGGAVLDAQTKRIYFEKFGVPEAKLDAEIKMAFQIISAVFQVIVGIAGVVGGCMVGAPEAGAPMLASAATGAADAAASAASVTQAAQGAAQAVSQIQTVASQAEQLSGLAKLVEEIKKIAEFSENLSKIAEGIGKLKEGALTLSEALDSKLDDETLKGVLDFTLPAADPSAATQWEEMASHFDDQIQSSIDMPIKGALDYKMSVDSLALAGRDMTTTGIASLQAAHQYLDLLSQAQPDANMAKRVQAQVDAMEKAQTVDNQVAAALYQRYLGLKRPVFAALQQRAWAFQYWALQAPTRPPDILDDSVDLQSQLAQAQQDFTDALSRFQPPPQVIQDTRVTLSDDAVAALKATGAATLEVGLDEAAFVGLGRVRVSDVQVWLEGAPASGSGPIRVLLSSPGAWRDRYRGTTWSFGGPAWGAEFRYARTGTTPAWTFDDGSKGYIKMAASVDPSLRGNYFYPTAFAAWSLQVYGADLSKLTKVTMVFAGTAISDPGGLAAAAAVGAPAVTTSGGRRQFSEGYKRALLAEAALCSKRAHLSALLRREGITGTHLKRWRQQAGESADVG